MAQQKLYDFRDPIYGFIAVKELEKRLIDTRPFQRLRHIRQLGTTFLVYPGANHTRFEHSLGTMHVADQMYDRIVFGYGSDAPSELEWDNADADRYREIVRLAALLHDLGHPPFSHASERIMPKGAKHEAYTRRMILETEVRGELEKASYSAEDIDEIAQIATGTAVKPDLTFLSEFITGEIGADRIDYLIRDSHHAGVHYGRFDFHRLLSTMEFAMLSSEEPAEEDGEELVPRVAIEQGGLHAVEGMLLARYFMFLQVYFHKTRSILDQHLVECLQQLDGLENGRYPREVGRFLLWDDDRVLSLLKEEADSLPVRRLLHREHFKVVHETKTHASIEERRTFSLLNRELEQRFGKQCLRQDAANVQVLQPYNYVDPLRVFVRMLTGPHADTYLPLVSRDERTEGASDLLPYLRPIRMYRIYCERKQFARIKELRDDLYSTMSRGVGT